MNSMIGTGANVKNAAKRGTRTTTGMGVNVQFAEKREMNITTGMNANAQLAEKHETNNIIFRSKTGGGNALEPARYAAKRR
jgi:hypothetical protein